MRFRKNGVELVSQVRKGLEWNSTSCSWGIGAGGPYLKPWNVFVIRPYWPLPCLVYFWILDSDSLPQFSVPSSFHPLCAQFLCVRWLSITKAKQNKAHAAGCSKIRFIFTYLPTVCKTPWEKNHAVKSLIQQGHGVLCLEELSSAPSNFRQVLELPIKAFFKVSFCPCTCGQRLIWDFCLGGGGISFTGHLLFEHLERSQTTSWAKTLSIFCPTNSKLVLKVANSSQQEPVCASTLEIQSGMKLE